MSAAREILEVWGNEAMHFLFFFFLAYSDKYRTTTCDSTQGLENGWKNYRRSFNILFGDKPGTGRLNFI